MGGYARDGQCAIESIGKDTCITLFSSSFYLQLRLTPNEWKDFVRFLRSIGPLNPDRFDRVAQGFLFDSREPAYGVASREVWKRQEEGLLKACGATMTKARVTFLSQPPSEKERKEYEVRKRTGLNQTIILERKGLLLFIKRELFLRLKRMCLNFKKPAS